MFTKNSQFADKKGCFLEKNLEKTAQNGGVGSSCPLKYLFVFLGIYLYQLKRWVRKNPETVEISGFFGCVSKLAATDGFSYLYRYGENFLIFQCFAGFFADFSFYFGILFRYYRFFGKNRSYPNRYLSISFRSNPVRKSNPIHACILFTCHGRRSLRQTRDW